MATFNRCFKEYCFTAATVCDSIFTPVVVANLTQTTADPTYQLQKAYIDQPHQIFDKTQVALIKQRNLALNAIMAIEYRTAIQQKLKNG